MPRPKRDYAAAIRQDIDNLDARIRDMVVRRSRLEQLLENYEKMDTGSVDTAEVLRSIMRVKPTPTKKPRRR